MEFVHPCSLIALELASQFRKFEGNVAVLFDQTRKQHREAVNSKTERIMTSVTDCEIGISD